MDSQVAALIFVFITGITCEAPIEDICHGYVHPSLGQIGACIPEAECQSGNLVADACPQYPSNYQCCFDENNPGREVRGAWVATVTNIDWPKSPSNTVATQQADLKFLVDRMEAAGINTIYFQVRPAGDALYNSSIEPWSEYLTGAQGQAPTPLWDPLQFIIDYAHDKGIEVHAWINPYRASLKPSFDHLAANHMAKQFPQYAYIYSTFGWMDPGAQEVQNRTYDVAIDLVTRYDIDGLHMDDYFYPYPVTGEYFPDNRTYEQYLQSGGNMNVADWRRDNVNKLMERLYEGVHAVKPRIIFSISPFGLYRPGEPEGMPSPIVGLDQYSQLYCDPKLWLQRAGWMCSSLNFIWAIQPPQQSYPVLLNWWLEQNPLGRHVYAGNYLSRVETNGWPLSEIRDQVAISRENVHRSRGSWGNVQFSAKMFRDNFEGTVDYFHENVYKYPALQPIFPWLNGDVSSSNPK
ncbi:hypothetical protein Ocin01_04383 [Orchesella cincta]|uniref:Glycosyl hydrolase-like 10 domain-containing protein n=1 Tax=Orchesella cincta TaxID=48709 RepID=A0A1D2NAM9_ORCCI|nr:hypothetical protein Ocin01_04383 [Orchesella cincta]